MEVSVKELLTNWEKYLEKEVVVKGWIRNNGSNQNWKIYSKIKKR